MLCTSHDAWIRHGQGISTLFQMQGPEMCRDRNMFELFRSNRFLIILSSLASRRPTFLSQASWKTMPWQQQKVAKDGMDLLHDIMADIPALRSTLLVLQDSIDTDEAKAATYHDLAEKALPVLAELLEWRKSWDALPEGHIISISAEERPENCSLHFTSLRSANCCSLYDAALILVLETILLSAQQGQLHAGAAATLYEKARQAAMEICASLDFQLQNSHTRLGQLFVLWPLREAGKILGNGTPEQQSLLERQKQKIATGQDLWEIAKSAFGKYG
ncbi:uncharacterized protein M437DRAFT_67588 [Aureobasidium melanogenum CBS 110374]|uniref:Uncharacterized protein n=1 Tax=Aureobasidium melanogenum (strain CBS 110374) TaxID=1043003 RepID=A0A074WFF7_AURM1|nr:uncharacterized protein M437DRAFT_67588 [Aureobasidium melanogenum CBS 110374]KEQ61216.1 hypothetical protein M437DRAFT_67588 [Aureobasidium melanogenum CBS 110374]